MSLEDPPGKWMFCQMVIWLRHRQGEWGFLAPAACLHSMSRIEEQWEKLLNLQFYSVHNFSPEVTVILRLLHFMALAIGYFSKWILNDQKLLDQKNSIYNKICHFKVNFIFFLPRGCEWTISSRLQQVLTLGACGLQLLRGRTRNNHQQNNVQPLSMLLSLSQRWGSVFMYPDSPAFPYSS